MAGLQITNHAFLPTSPVSTPINLQGYIDLSQVVSDYNAFYQTADQPLVTLVDPPAGIPTSLTFAQWQALGQDLHSYLFDPTDPAIAASIAGYNANAAIAVPSLIIPPCCARFWFCVGQDGDDPCLDVSHPNFSQHLNPGIGPLGWSDFISYDDTEGFMQTATYCGACDKNGLLTPIPTTYP